MELNYVYSESTVKPLSIEFAKNSVYLRRNVTEEVREDSPFYVYEEACLSVEEFNEYIARLKALNVMNDIPSLLAGQTNGDNNQLIIMEAIADLYELIMSK